MRGRNNLACTFSDGYFSLGLEVTNFLTVPNLLKMVFHSDSWDQEVAGWISPHPPPSTSKSPVPLGLSNLEKNFPSKCLNAFLNPSFLNEYFQYQCLNLTTKKFIFGKKKVFNADLKTEYLSIMKVSEPYLLSSGKLWLNWPNYCNISNSCFLRMVAFCSHRLKMRLNFQIVSVVKGWMHSGFKSTNS